jgi:uncharacterized membrane-anchored protein YhcB (DUF1043 family)
MNWSYVIIIAAIVGAAIGYFEVNLQKKQ